MGVEFRLFAAAAASPQGPEWHDLSRFSWLFKW
jgi:hypothetical protein